MYSKFIALTASIAITATGLAVLAPPAFGRAPALALTPTDGAVGHVSFADLDLTSVGGENALRARVNTAVRNICASLADRSSGTFAEANCRSASWKDVDPQIERAVQRARELAATGTSPIPPVTIALPK
jgi:UrcA family protein